MAEYKELTDAKRFRYKFPGIRFSSEPKYNIFNDDFVMSRLGKGNIKKGKQAMKLMLKRIFYWIDELERVEVEALMKCDYTASNSRKKELMVKDEKGRFEYVICVLPENESLQHLRDKEFIASLNRHASETEWKVPDSMHRIDVIFRIGDFSMGVEIQKSALEYRRMDEKVSLLTDYFDRWFIIVPKKYVQKYSYLNNQFGKVVTMKEGVKEITEILSKISKETNKA